MLDYWLRLRRKFPNKEIHQIVIYLKPTNSPLVYQDRFISEGLAEATNQIALNMLKSSISLDLIAQSTGLSVEQVQQLQQQIGENTRNSN